jgi:hypothetical protein
MPRPDLNRVPVYFHNYINQVSEDDLMQAMRNQTAFFIQFLKNIPADKRNYRYAENKWTTKEVVQHIMDTERIFAYRALCIARKDTTPLPGFDENNYAANSKAADRKWDEMVDEFIAVRQSTELLFNSFDEEQLESSGNAGNKLIYVAGIGFTIVGHSNHHKKIIAERYL